MYLGKMRCMIVLFLSLFVYHGRFVAQTKTYDKNWWLSSTKEGREDFLDGYGDCSYYDAHQINWNNVFLEEKIDTYYSSNPKSEIPFFALVEKVAKEKLNFKPLKNGEKHPEKHGVFDGDYSFEQAQDGKLFFVEGYEACQKNKIPGSKNLRFSPKEQVLSIDRWYGISDKDPVINKDREYAKIANVLLKLEKP